MQTCEDTLFSNMKGEEIFTNSLEDPFNLETDTFDFLNVPNNITSSTISASEQTNSRRPLIQPNPILQSVERNQLRKEVQSHFNVGAKVQTVVRNIQPKPDTTSYRLVPIKSIRNPNDSRQITVSETIPDNRLLSKSVNEQAINKIVPVSNVNLIPTPTHIKQVSCCNCNDFLKILY